MDTSKNGDGGGGPQVAKSKVSKLVAKPRGATVPRRLDAHLPAILRRAREAFTYILIIVKTSGYPRDCGETPSKVERE